MLGQRGHLAQQTFVWEEEENPEHPVSLLPVPLALGMRLPLQMGAMEDISVLLSF